MPFKTLVQLVTTYVLACSLAWTVGAAIPVRPTAARPSASALRALPVAEHLLLEPSEVKRWRLLVPHESEVLVELTGEPVRRVVLRGAGRSLVPRSDRREAGLRRVEHAIERGGELELVLEAPASGWTGSLTARRADGLLFPVAGMGPDDVISTFGAPRDGGRRRHEGIDIAAPRGHLAVAPARSRVRRVGQDVRGGKVAWLTDLQHGYSYYFAHLDEQLVRVGDVLEAGNPVGRVGNTGNARTTRPHLHFGVHRGGRALDPSPLLGDDVAPLPDEPLLGRWARPTEPVVNLRSGPSLDAPRVGRLAATESACVTGRAGRWRRVRWEGGDAWVSADLLVALEPEGLVGG